MIRMVASTGCPNVSFFICIRDHCNFLKSAYSGSVPDPVDHDYTDYFTGGAYAIFALENYDMSAEFWATIKCQPEEIPILISNYSVPDPEAAPDGKNAITITAQLSYECNDGWRWNESYEMYREYRDQVAQILIERAEKILPGLSDHIEVIDISSPLTIERFTLNPRGSWAGFDLAASDDVGWIYEENHRSPFPNLFFAGAWASESGIGIVLESGEIAARLVLEDAGSR